MWYYTFIALWYYKCLMQMYGLFLNKTNYTHCVLFDKNTENQRKNMLITTLLLTRSSLTPYLFVILDFKIFFIAPPQ